MSSERQFGTTVNILVDGNATVALVELTDLDTLEPVAAVTGSSRRAPGDKHNEEIAVSLAMGRAFEKLGRKLTKHGDKLVKAADRAEAEKKARKEKAAKTAIAGIARDYVIPAAALTEADNVNNALPRFWVPFRRG